MQPRERYERTLKQRRRDTFMEIVKKNFREGDMYITCTYQQAETSPTSAKRRIRNFVRAIQFSLRNEGYDDGRLSWICVTEIRYGKNVDTLKRAEMIHHHVLMRGVPPQLREDIEYLWHGGNCIVENLRGDISALASQLADNGMVSYTVSRNIVKGGTNA